MRRNKVYAKMIPFYVLTAIILAVMLTVFNGMQSTGQTDGIHEFGYKTYVVSSGETLWSIAEENLSEDFPTCSSYIEEVMRVNSMQTAAIYPGDLIAIPVKNTEKVADME